MSNFHSQDWSGMLDRVTTRSNEIKIAPIVSVALALIFHDLSLLTGSRKDNWTTYYSKNIGNHALLWIRKYTS
ncbi:hypothetical protein ACSBR1_007833 [Camellia fascicularis]